MVIYISGDFLICLYLLWLIFYVWIDILYVNVDYLISGLMLYLCCLYLGIFLFVI